MLVVFTRFGTLFRVTFSSLWYEARLLFSSWQPTIKARDLEVGNPIPPGNALFSESGRGRSAPVSFRFTNSPTRPTSSNFVPPCAIFHASADLQDVPASGIFNKMITGANEHNPKRNISSPRIPLRTITNNYGNVLSGAPTDERTMANTHHHCRPQYLPPSPPLSLPGSIGWRQEKLKLLEEARAWNTRVKTDCRYSLPLAKNISSLRSSTLLPTVMSGRRASAPARLGETRLPLEERLQQAVSRASPPPWPILQEPQFIIGDLDEDIGGSDSFEEDVTYVAEVDITKTSIDIAAPMESFGKTTPAAEESSELPYLLSTSTLQSETLTSASESAGTLTEMLNALEAIFTTRKWTSLVDIEGAAAGGERRRGEVTTTQVQAVQV